MNHTLNTRPSVFGQRAWSARKGQRGSAMIEFAVVGPIMMVIAGMLIQFVLLYNAKNIVNHAAFMATRAGAMGNANLGTIRNAYARSMIPLYGGGTNTTELATAYATALADIGLGDGLTGNSRIEILNPTTESFDDHEDTALFDKYSARAIRNSAVSYSSTTVSTNSGQSFQDANLLKIRIQHGFEMRVPFAGKLMQFLMKWNDRRIDPFATKLYGMNPPRVPIMTNVTTHMLSDPVENDASNFASTPGQGNNGTPEDPGFTEALPKEPPKCVTAGCTVIIDPNFTPGNGANNQPRTPSLYGCPPGSIDCTQICRGNT